MSNFFSQNFHSNTVGQWFTAFLLIALSIIAGKILYWISIRIIKPLLKKTKSELDDIIFDLCEEPMVMATILVGIWFSLKTLVLPNGIELFIKNAFFGH